MQLRQFHHFIPQPPILVANQQLVLINHPENQDWRLLFLAFHHSVLRYHLILHLINFNPNLVNLKFLILIPINLNLILINLIILMIPDFLGLINLLVRINHFILILILILINHILVILTINLINLIDHNINHYLNLHCCQY